MTYLLSGMLAIVVAIFGWLLLPFVSMIVTMPIMLLVGIVNKFLAYMLSRYTGLAVDFGIMIWLITWAGGKWGLITWPAWLIAGWCMFAAGNTLILFDIQCYLTGSGAWAAKHDVFEAKPG